MCRKLKIYFALFLIFNLLSGKSIGQSGFPFIKNFPPPSTMQGEIWSIDKDTSNLLFMSYKKGLLSFDGRDWNYIPTQIIPTQIKWIPAIKRMFFTSNKGYGYIQRTSKGTYRIQQLASKEDSNSAFFSIAYTDSSIYFQGPDITVRHKLKQLNKQDKRWTASNQERFTGIIIHPDNIFINRYPEGLFRLDSDTLFPIVTGFWTKDEEIIFTLQHSIDRIMVGTDANHLYLFDGIKFYHYSDKVERYLEDNILTYGILYSDSIYAFSTLNGGIFLFNRNSKEIINEIDALSGLDDDEIFTMCRDQNNGIWVSHNKGISRISPELPLKNFSYYPGLVGDITDIHFFNEHYHIATTEGVFQLSKVKDYKEIERWIKKTVKTDSPEEEAKTSSTQRPIRKLFKSIFKETEEKEEKEVASKPATEVRWIKTTKKVLETVSHQYKKLPGLDVRSKKLISNGKKLYALTSTGIYDISGSQPQNILKDWTINNVLLLERQMLCLSEQGLYLINLEEQTKKTIEETRHQKFYDAKKEDSTIWVSGESIIYKYRFNKETGMDLQRIYNIHTPYSEILEIKPIRDTLFVYGESGFYFLDKSTDSIVKYSQDIKQEANLPLRYLETENMLWYFTNGEWHGLDNNKITNYLNLLGQVQKIKKLNGYYWFLDPENIYAMSSDTTATRTNNFKLIIRQATINDSIQWNLKDDLSLQHHQSLTITLQAPEYYRPDQVEYQYRIKGIKERWSDWTASNQIQLLLKPGKFIIEVRARDYQGNITSISRIPYLVAPPFTQSILFYVLIGLGIIILFTFIVIVRERKLRHDKKILEQKVKERTQKIEHQKFEIEEQRDEIMAQRDEIFKQKEDITDSIEYASRIQKAVLPLKDHFNKAFPEHFILYKPRDIVSGDFYWIGENEDKIYFTAGDCTGHGVPGAFMSMLGISSLNEIMAARKNPTAARMLELLREKIKFSLHQTGKSGEAKDGMDMALCVIHKKEQMLEFAGAFNPLYLIRNNELTKYKADRMPIGIYYAEKEKFTNHKIPYEIGDCLYMFSDGYVDQFGGPNDEKFKSKRFKKLLLDVHQKPMKEQLEILDRTIIDWTGDRQQVDDIIVIGIKLIKKPRSIRSGAKY